MSPQALRLGAPAKVNLFLRILTREESGYHGLETLYAAVGLEDRIYLEVGPGDDLRLEVASAHDLGPLDENLAFRAARRLLEAADLSRKVRIVLEKRIPPGAGLGGGSSDAAAVLRGLNKILGSPLDRHGLVRVGGSLGADVPFFLSPSPLALAWSRGQRMLSLDPLPERAVLLALPPLRIDTAGAYRELARERAEAGSPPPPPAILERAAIGTWERIAGDAENDFEGSVFRAHPLVARLAEALADTDPVLSLLSGSGGAVFAIFGAAPLAEEARDRLAGRFPHTRFEVTRTLRAFPAPGPP